MVAVALLAKGERKNTVISSVQRSIVLGSESHADGFVLMVGLADLV